jgi:hypothetical protein
VIGDNRIAKLSAEQRRAVVYFIFLFAYAVGVVGQAIGDQAWQT